MAIKIISPGMFSTFQDKGRKGYRNLGIPCGGVMDMKSQYIANALVGKTYDAPVLEMTGFGVSFEVLMPMVISLTGSPSDFSKNGLFMPMNESIKLEKGDLVSVKKIRGGLRAYMAFSHEPVLERVFKSYSTYPMFSFGGYKGRQLKLGDSIEMNKRPLPALFAYRTQSSSGPIRVMMAYEEKDFIKASFLNNSYEVSSDLSRMGMKLQGEPLLARGGHGIISSPVTPGTIQVPGSGQPIILLREGQTTGGYKRIASVIYEDLDRLAHFKPGDKIKFEAISFEKAKALKKEYLKKLRQINEHLIAIRCYNVKSGSKKFYVTVQTKE